MGLLLFRYSDYQMKKVTVQCTGWMYQRLGVLCSHTKREKEIGMTDFFFIYIDCLVPLNILMQTNYTTPCL